MNKITITFASAADYETARRQIDKARAYQARGSQLGALGCALLLRTLERATDISSTNHKAAQAAEPKKEKCK
jgi:hypothetical protein